MCYGWLHVSSEMLTAVRMVPVLDLNILIRLCNVFAHFSLLNLAFMLTSRFLPWLCSDLAYNGQPNGVDV